MFGMRTKTVAAAVEEPSQNYGPGSASYSPEGTDGLAYVGLPTDNSVRDEPNESTSGAPDTRLPRPPDPTVGGMPGIANGLGWSTGLRPSRTLRTRMGGETLVVPTMGVHPAEGPVGVSNRTGRLESGVAALIETWLPSQQEINNSFVGGSMRNRNPLDSD